MWVHLLKLIRWPNLLIVFITQWIVWSQLICKSLLQVNLNSSLSFFQFLLLSISTVLVASAGYVINDIEDVKIDLINKPEKVIVGTHISSRLCYTYYYSLLGLGLLIAIFLGWQLGKMPYVLLFPFFAGLLHLYATRLKKTPLIGNILISLFVASVPMIIFLADSKELFFSVNQRVFQVLLMYAALAFLANLAREIIKDMQDVRGDKAFGARTLPILAGPKNSKALVMLVLLSIFFALIFWTFVWDVKNQDNISIFIGTAPLLIICLGLIVKLPPLESSDEFGKWSLGIKVFMLFGLLFLYLQ